MAGAQKWREIFFCESNLSRGHDDHGANKANEANIASLQPAKRAALCVCQEGCSFCFPRKPSSKVT